MLCSGRACRPGSGLPYNEHIRRFHFVGTEFVSLKESIARLFSLNDEFVLKYLDDEKEYVTLESQEDYLTALEITPTILRLVIVKPSGPCIVPSSPSFPCFDQGHERKRCGKHGGHQVIMDTVDTTVITVTTVTGRNTVVSQDPILLFLSIVISAKNKNLFS